MNQRDQLIIAGVLLWLLWPRQESTDINLTWWNPDTGQYEEVPENGGGGYDDRYEEEREWERYLDEFEQQE